MNDATTIPDPCVKLENSSSTVPALCLVKMASTKFYFADSKASVRTKLGLQHSKHDEDFLEFEVASTSRYLLPH